MLYSLFEKGDGDVDLGWLAAAELVVAGGWRLAAVNLVVLECAWVMA